MKTKVLVIGGGAAGMMAGYAASLNGAEVIILEKNEKLGKKLFITGKGRCNVTNACEDEDFFKNVISNPRFLYSAYYGFNNISLMSLIEENGCPLKTERGNRVFPVSDHSYDILDALKNMLKKNDVRVILNTKVTSIEDDHVFTDTGKKFPYDSLIIATGGVSYKQTGSTGDGYRFAEEMGHEIIEPIGGLIPLECKEVDDCVSMQGLSLKNVKLRIDAEGNKKPVFEDFGEMLFTHFGISGPLVLSASSYIGRKYKGSSLTAHIDLKSALSYDELDKRVLRDFDEFKNKSFGNSLVKLLPSSMIPVIVKRSGIDPLKKVNEIKKEEREALVNLLKDFRLSITGTRDINEAIITMGGVNVKEINPSTMESKIKKNIYFAGEVIDIDALTGGFNLQSAFSTGYLAGTSASALNE